MSARRTCCLATIFHLLTALSCEPGGEACADLGHFPWLDRPVRRFVIPPWQQMHVAVCPNLLGSVVATFVKHARIPAIAVEYQYDPPTAGEGEAEPLVDMAFQRPTPRKVLGEIMRKWSAFRPLVAVRERGGLSLVEQQLHADPTWPLNAKRVSGFSRDPHQPPALAQASVLRELMCRGAEGVRALVELYWQIRDEKVKEELVLRIADICWFPDSAPVALAFVADARAANPSSGTAAFLPWVQRNAQWVLEHGRPQDAALPPPVPREEQATGEDRPRPGRIWPGVSALLGGVLVILIAAWAFISRRRSRA